VKGNGSIVQYYMLVLNILRQYCHLRLLYISVKFIDVYFFETVSSFSDWNLTEGVLSRK
jgi:hypothetical protein